MSAFDAVLSSILSGEPPKLSSMQFRLRPKAHFAKDIVAPSNTDFRRH